MHFAILSSLAITALAASAQALVPRDELNIDYFTCDSATSTAVCSDKPDSTMNSLETADETVGLEGLGVFQCEPYFQTPTKPLCCGTYTKYTGSAAVAFADSGSDCTNGNLVTGIGELVSHTG